MLDVRDEAPVVVDRIVDLESLALAELVVLLAVARRDVDEPGPGIHRHEVRGADDARAVDPRVTILQTDEGAARHARPLARRVELRDARERLGKLRRDDQCLAARLERDVVFFGMDGDREVRRQRPRCGGPDDE